MGSRPERYFRRANDSRLVHVLQAGSAYRLGCASADVRTRAVRCLARC
ncbi:hypothetical protein M3J09_003465 [Ascochyta lentis]